VLGFAAWRAIERLVAENHVGQIVEMLDESPAAAAPPAEARRPPVRADIAPLWTRITSPDVVGQLARTEPPDFATIDRVLPRLSTPGFEPLLDALAESESRTTRRGLLDRLTRAPRELGMVITSRLAGDIPWYVARNLLLILDGLPGLPEGFSTAAFIAHSDARVRREALKLALKIPAERELALLGALSDPDPRMVRVGLTAALEHCPASAVQFVTRLAYGPAVAAELRVLAIKVLGRAGNTDALDALLHLVDGGTNWLRRPKLAVRSLELLAALMALSSGWPNDRKVAAVLALAAASPDPDVRNAATAGTRAARAQR